MLLNNDLYFIPILARALEQDDVRDACESALKEIDALGEQSVCRQGHLQFQMFMDQVLAEAALEHAVGLAIFDKAMLPYAPELTLVLTKGETPFLIVPVPGNGETSVTSPVTPGHYRLSTITGWLLWSDTLRSEDVFLADAQPYASLALAADSDENLEPFATRKLSLLEGEVRLRLYPGIEAGSLILDISGRREET